MQDKHGFLWCEKDNIGTAPSKQKCQIKETESNIFHSEMSHIIQLSLAPTELTEKLAL